MLSLIRRIQSPSALFAFEAAARHLSFTRAAHELNVSQPAISLSVKKIETALGAQLFERRHRAIALTEIGERFYADVSFGLMHILRSAEAIAIQRGGHHVTLACSTGFGHYWMMPRMAAFKARFPHIDLRLHTTDRDIDLTGDDVSIAIRRGAGHWDGYDAFLLAEECIDPVCSPGFLAPSERPRDAPAIANNRLIHLEEPFRLRPKWGDWFAAHGVSYRDRGDGLRLNDYALVLQAAVAGEGIAMGWRHLTQPLVERGLLVRLFDGGYDVGQGMYVIWPKARPLTPQAVRFLDWLREQAVPPPVG